MKMKLEEPEKTQSTDLMGEPACKDSDIDCSVARVIVRMLVCTKYSEVKS